MPCLCGGFFKTHVLLWAFHWFCNARVKHSLSTCFALLQNHHGLSRQLVKQLIYATKACDWAAAATALLQLGSCRPKSMACHLGHFLNYALPRCPAQVMEALLELVQKLVRGGSLAGCLTSREGAWFDGLDLFIAACSVVRVL